MSVTRERLYATSSMPISISAALPMMASARPRTFLGFDFGMKRIGIAAGQDLTATTTALEAVRVTDAIPDWITITRLVNSWRPDALVVGLPSHLDGTEHDKTRAARDWVHNCNSVIICPCT